MNATFTPNEDQNKSWQKQVFEEKGAKELEPPQEPGSSLRANLAP